MTNLMDDDYVIELFEEQEQEQEFDTQVELEEKRIQMDKEQEQELEKLRQEIEEEYRLIILETVRNIILVKKTIKSYRSGTLNFLHAHLPKNLRAPQIPSLGTIPGIPTGSGKAAENRQKRLELKSQLAEIRQAAQKDMDNEGIKQKINDLSKKYVQYDLINGYTEGLDDMMMTKYEDRNKQLLPDQIDINARLNQLYLYEQDVGPLNDDQIKEKDYYEKKRTNKMNKLELEIQKTKGKIGTTGNQLNLDISIAEYNQIFGSTLGTEYKISDIEKKLSIESDELIAARTERTSNVKHIVERRYRNNIDINSPEYKKANLNSNINDIKKAFNNAKKVKGVVYKDGVPTGRYSPDVTFKNIQGQKIDNDRIIVSRSNNKKLTPRILAPPKGGRSHNTKKRARFKVVERVSSVELEARKQVKGGTPLEKAKQAARISAISNPKDVVISYNVDGYGKKKGKYKIVSGKPKSRFSLPKIKGGAQLAGAGMMGGCMYLAMESMKDENSPSDAPGSAGETHTCSSGDLGGGWEYNDSMFFKKHTTGNAALDMVTLDMINLIPMIATKGDDFKNVGFSVIENEREVRGAIDYSSDMFSTQNIVNRLIEDSDIGDIDKRDKMIKEIMGVVNYSNTLKKDFEDNGLIYDQVTPRVLNDFFSIEELFNLHKKYISSDPIYTDSKEQRIKYIMTFLNTIDKEEEEEIVANLVAVVDSKYRLVDIIINNGGYGYNYDSVI